MVSILRKVRWALHLMRSRTFAVGALSMVLAFTIYKITDLTHAVYIRDGESVRLTYTMKDDVEDILQTEGITVMASDIVNFSGFSTRIAEVEIQRSFPISLTVNGSTRYLEVTEQTVGDLLDQENVTLDGNDKINMDRGELLYEGAHVVVERIDYATRSETMSIPYETVQTQTSLLKPGRKRVLVYGEEGTQVTTYSQKLKDGQVIFEEAVDTQVLEEPVAQEELVGAQVAISPLDFGYNFDENGIPIGYTKVLENQKATGYSARAGARTASGRHAVPGHVAVNPEIIPYGTKLYIASPDNSFIYGYAIAADTGIGLMDGVTDIDLFYDSYTESLLNSVRYVNVYVLD